MGYSVDCFKEFNIRNQMDYSGAFTCHMVDYENGDYISPSSITKINKLMKSYGLDFDLVPNLGEAYFENLSEEEAKRLQSRMVKPEECLEFANEHQLLNKVEETIPECLLTMQNLMKRWKDGYYVILTY
ncbi:hypothetical protein ACFVS2_25530 [Brevibacillus sp. NPDC058079]|uniref:hypothetical protein n=1 Tax=Brevibacillus sp. NPDC058079 TaxID=3346330 RepID=UPI0036E0DD06